MELKIPVQINGFELAEDLANAVLDYSYKGRTLKEWDDSISKPVTNADRIRSMSDEELAEWLCDIAGWLPMYEGKMHPILDWLKQEVK